MPELLSDANSQHQQAAQALEAARFALGRGDLNAARRAARRAATLQPHSERAWLYLAAASEPKAGLAYVARALEINPRSKPARKAIRWLVRRLPPKDRRAALREADLPPIQPLPLEALSPRRLFSMRIALPAMAMAAGIGAWLGGQPADAREPHTDSNPVAKASLTATPTNTPTATPTPTNTPTPTATFTPTPTSTPTPRPAVAWNYATDPSELADEGRWIDVDIGAQRVTAYEGESAVRSFVVSTGTAYHPTVTGQFKIYVKYAAAPMSGPGYYLPGVPWIMYFYKGYALHGTYWHDNFGTPMSHGCVNLTIPDAEWLYNFASVGTLVNVRP